MNELFARLNRVKRLKCELDKIKTRIEELHSNLLPSAIRYDKDKVQTSPTDTMLEVVAEINELEGKYRETYINFSKAMTDVEDLIEQVQDINQKLVLRRRYIKCMKFSAIAEDMNYSEEWVYKTHQKAIEVLSGVQ